MIDTSIDLQEFDDVFASNGETAEVADGDYTARIHDVSLTRSKAGNPMLVWDLKILGPEFQGRQLKKRRAITDKTVPYVKRDLETCGLTLSKMSELNGQIHRMIDLDIEITKVTRGGSPDIFFNRRVGEGKPYSKDVPDDDLPF